MELISTTPFGQRPLSAGQLAGQELARAESPLAAFDKWQLFRELCVARLRFGVSDRDLTVLNALLSFHKPKDLADGDDLIVYPSNKVLGERAHGMAESTLRRHIAALVEAGLIARHDSPNGKRYAARDSQGSVVRAFGFNLRPMLVRAAEIAQAAAEARDMADQMRRMREKCTLTLRDTAKLAEYHAQEHASDGLGAILSAAEGLRRTLRRKLGLEALKALWDEIAALASVLGHMFNDSEKMSASAVHSERHYHNSNKDTYDLEPCLEKAGGEGSDHNVPEPERGRAVPPNLPLGLVLKACPDICDYARDGIANWQDLINTAEFVRGMMGISPDAWLKAKEAMGVGEASIVLAAILQRISEINAPGGYLRALTDKANDDSFSPGPMVMALLNRAGGKAA